MKKKKRPEIEIRAVIRFLRAKSDSPAKVQDKIVSHYSNDVRSKR